MSTLLDTNILTRTAQQDHPHYAAASEAVNVLLERGEQLYIVPQNLYEFWAVATRPKHDNGLNMTVPEARTRIARIKRMFILLRDERGILSTWERLMNRHEVMGKTTHDARLVAAMHRHNLESLLTFNASHFARFSGIIVLTPEALLAGDA